MPLESGSTISDLDPSWPLGGDPLIAGDDHIRLVKSILKTQFPGDSGGGLKLPVTAGAAELNNTVGSKSNIQNQIDALSNQGDMGQSNLYAPKGTVMLFANIAPPLGWTQIISDINDRMLRLVNVAGGGKGGIHSPSAHDFTHAHVTQGHALTVSEMPSHNHNVSVTQRVTGDDAAGGSRVLTADRNIAHQLVNITGMETHYVGSSLAHNHGETGRTDLRFNPKYIDSILASKD